MTPASMGDGNQNSWSSDLTQKFCCMMEACFSLGLFAILHTVFSCDPLAKYMVSARVQQEGEVSS